MRAVALSVAFLLSLAGSAAAHRVPPSPMQPASSKSALDPSQPLTFQQGGDTVWLQVYGSSEACSCNPLHGGECTGGPDERETFCFDKYVPTTDDSLYKYYGSPGTPFFAPSTGNGFRTADLRTYPAPDNRFYWHLDTYQAYSGYSWWCGTPTGTLCEDWDNAPGYGDLWKQYLVLDPDLPGISAGDTVRISCRVRYDVECDYDYAYLCCSNDAGATWSTLAVFNGASGSPSGSPCGVDYFGNDDAGQGFPSWQYFPASLEDGEVILTDPDDFRVAFRFESDGAWSDEDGRGNTDGAFYVDNVILESTSFGGGILEVEDMDVNFEPVKWSLVRPPAVANHWWMPYDPDPPREPGDTGGADVCMADASWQWCAIPHIHGRWRIPPESNGFSYRLMSPKVALSWGEPTVPVEYAGAVCQCDVYADRADATCDGMDAFARMFRSNENAWCAWEALNTWWWWEPQGEWMFDSNLWVEGLAGAGSDSVQFAWDIWDTGNTGDFCWTTQVPAPHQGTRFIVDNVSFGVFDQSATFFHAREIDLFQDTFDLETDAHNALCANGDMPKTLAGQESLTVDIYDINGLTGPGSWVRLYFSDNRGGTWNYHDMRLAFPDPNNPDIGGTYCGSISPGDVPSSSSGEWGRGEEIWYYVQVKDNAGNYAYWPKTAAPGTPWPERPYFNNYLEFSILTGVGRLSLPNRILLVDDFGQTDYDYSPCMSESTVMASEDFYEGVLLDMGFGYDKYDVGGASTGLSNEPWGILYSPDPSNPDSLVRSYDAVIWFTSRLEEHTVTDTMQCRLVDFVRKGGHLLICGNDLGVDMTDYGNYDDVAADTCGFYGGLIGAKMSPPGSSALGVRNPDYVAKGAGGVPGSVLTGTDKFHFHLGCPTNARHDLLRVNDSPPFWSHPRPYLIYDSGYAAGDTLVAIYNRYDATAQGGDLGGKVVHMAFDLTAMVDSTQQNCDGTIYKGRNQIMEDIVVNLFGLVPIVAVDSDPLPARYEHSLGQNHPNPFNPDTDIPYSLRNAGRVLLRIYNVRGQVVRTLVDRAAEPGRYSAHWDGANDDGRPVATGLYFCRMEAGDFRATRKMLLLK